jgi:hypothetical protein
MPLLVDQSDSNISGTKFINNFRWITKVFNFLSIVKFYL